MNCPLSMEELTWAIQAIQTLPDWTGAGFKVRGGVTTDMYWIYCLSLTESQMAFCTILCARYTVGSTIALCYIICREHI